MFNTDPNRLEQVLRINLYHMANIKLQDCTAVFERLDDLTFDPEEAGIGRSS